MCLEVFRTRRGDEHLEREEGRAEGSAGAGSMCFHAFKTSGKKAFFRFQVLGNVSLINYSEYMKHYL